MLLQDSDQYKEAFLKNLTVEASASGKDVLKQARGYVPRETCGV